MRNLKRVLSLALAAVMLMGMMIVGTSAANVSDFTDADQITNVEAATITSAIEIFSGYGDGTFRPGNIVTRAEMAVIICKMLYGANVNGANFGGVNIFSDVTKDWQIGYVNLCNSLNIVNGYGNGTFQPDKTVNTAEAALMICKALGYFQTDAEYGNNWELAAITKATQLGLFGKLTLSAKEGLTRDSVSVMVFNALAYAVPVDYNSTFNSYYMRGGSIMSGVPTGADVAAVNQFTLGYKNFDLVGTFGRDEYGRPGQQWGFGEYRIANDGSILQTILREDITFTANTPVVTYNSKKNANAVSGDLKGYTFSKTVTVSGTPSTVDSAALTEDGVPNSTISRTNGAGAISGLTANGVIVEVYAGANTNDAREITEVVVIRPQVANVTAVNTRNKTVTLSMNRGTNGTTAVTYVVRESDPFYSVVSGAQTGDVLLAVYGSNGLLDLWVPESVTGTITEIKWNGSDNQIAGVGGTRYTVSSRITTDGLHQFNYDNNQINNAATVYLDRNGYAMYVAPATIAAVSNYLYVTNVWQTKEIIRGIPTPTNYVRGVNTDGEIVTLKIANNVFEEGNRLAENANPNTTVKLVDNDNFPGVSYTYTQAPGGAYVFNNAAYNASTAPKGRGVDGKYASIATAVTPTWSDLITPAAGGYGVGFVAEYQQGAVDNELYLLKVPTEGSYTSAGTMTIGLPAGIQSYERVINNVYMATDVNFISANYTIASDRLTASASAGVQYVKAALTYIPVVTQDSAGHRLITAVYVLNGTGYTTDLYYVSGQASYRVGYTDAAGRPAVGYNNGLYLAGESVDTIAVKDAAITGFYQKVSMDGDAYVLERYVESNQKIEGLVADAYNRSILVDGVWYDVSNAIWTDLTRNGIDSVDSIRAIMDTDIKLRASFTFDSSNERKVPCLYITSEEDMPGEVVSYVATATPSTATAHELVMTGAEDTVFAVSGVLKTGAIPAEATGSYENDHFAGLKNQDYFVVKLHLPGATNPSGMRITTPVQNSNNWNNGTYPWGSDGWTDGNGDAQDGTGDGQLYGGVKRGVTAGGYVSTNYLYVIVQAGTVSTVEVMTGYAGVTGASNVYNTKPAADAFDADFQATYTITIDATGVTPYVAP